MQRIEIPTPHGHVLDGQLLSPAASPNGSVIIINSAMGVLKRYYFDFASYLAAQGFAVITYDYHGIGESRTSPVSATVASIALWGQNDYAAVINYVKSKFPDRKLMVVGHSIGGQIIGMTPASQSVDAFLLVASQTPYWPNFPRWPKLWLLWYFLIPVLTPLFGYFPARKLGLFEDLPSEVALQWMRAARNSNYIFDEKPDLRDHFASLRRPMKVISLSDDTYAPKKAVDDLLKFYSNVRVEHDHIHPQDINEKHIGHFGFFRKKYALTLWPGAVDWLKNTIQQQAMIP